MYAPPQERHPEERIFSMLLYIIAAIGAVAQYAESLGMNVAGCVILAIAGFMVKVQRLTAAETPYASHVEWMSRTISIGSRFLFPLSIAAMLYLIHSYTDIESTRKSFESSDNKDIGVMMNIVKGYLDRNEQKLNLIVTGSLTPPILWWVRRCCYGLVKANKSEPIDFPYSFF
jgi:uncharacterized membrane protein